MPILNAMVRDCSSDSEISQKILKEQLQLDYAPGAPMAIKMPLVEANRHFNKYKCIKCHGTLGPTRAEWAVASGHLSRLPSESKTDINILEYLHKLIPHFGDQIGLITFQNGVQNSFDDFLDMGKSIISHFNTLGASKTEDISNYAERPLCIGLYNRSGDLFCDVRRVNDHLRDHETFTVCRTRLMLTTIADLLETISPSLRWFHIIHSEAGAITYRAIKEMADKHRNSLKKRLIIGAYGPAHPIPKNFALKVWNVYSDKDTTTGRLGKPYTGDTKYEIEVLKSKMPGNPILPPGDHGFKEATYQAALEKHIDEIRGEYGIYPNKK